MPEWAKISGFVALAVAVVGGFIALAIILIATGHGPPSTGELERRANDACGSDRVADVEYNPRGFGHRQSFETTCRRDDGSVYIVVNR